jgi:hypothetical protein
MRGMSKLPEGVINSTRHYGAIVRVIAHDDHHPD